MFAVERVEILPDRAARPFFVGPVDVSSRDALEPAGVGLDHAGIDREPLAADQTDVHATPHDALEHMAQHIAVAKPTVTVVRERRVIRHPVLEPETAEPAIGQVHLDLLAQPAVRADRMAIAQQHDPDHQLRINRRAAGVAVIRCQLGAQPTQVEYGIEPTYEVIRRNPIVEAKLVEQTVLTSQLLTHHDPDPSSTTTRAQNHDASLKSTGVLQHPQP